MSSPFSAFAVLYCLFNASWKCLSQIFCPILSLFTEGESSSSITAWQIKLVSKTYQLKYSHFAHDFVSQKFWKAVARQLFLGGPSCSCSYLKASLGQSSTLTHVAESWCWLVVENSADSVTWSARFTPRGLGLHTAWQPQSSQTFYMVAEGSACIVPNHKADFALTFMI